MSAPPSVAPFAGLLADLAADLTRGASCLVVCDKGWTLPVFRDLRQRLKAKGIRCEYLDGRPDPSSDSPADVGVMLTTITQIRKAVRGDAEGAIFALPHLDVMATTDGGWTNISREVVPLLYENAAAQWLGFCDPSLPLLPVVEKLFGKRYVLGAPYRTVEGATAPRATTTPPPPAPQPAPQEPATTVANDSGAERANAATEEASGDGGEVQTAAGSPQEASPDPPSEEQSKPAPVPPHDGPHSPTSSPGAPG